MIDQLKERQRLAWHYIDVLNERGGSHEELADAYERCAGKLDDILGDALNAIEALEESARFGEQCYQDRCENAYSPQSVVKEMEAEIERLRNLNNRALAIITGAIMHGMPVTEEVAAVRNEIVGIKNGKDQ